MALVAALRALPDHQRETLALHYLADLPVADVAATLGVPVGHRQGPAQPRPHRPRRGPRDRRPEIFGGSHA